MATRKPKAPEGRKPAFPVDAGTEFKGISIAGALSAFLVGSAIAGPHGDKLMHTTDDATMEGVCDEVIHWYEVMDRRLRHWGYA